ncbi:MAG: hypothetical protein ACI3XF_01410 [Eubacteriales bacterium]
MDVNNPKQANTQKPILSSKVAYAPMQIKKPNSKKRNTPEIKPIILYIFADSLLKNTPSIISHLFYQEYNTIYRILSENGRKQKIADKARCNKQALLV